MAKPNPPKEVLIVGSKMKAAISSAGMRCEGGLVEAVSDKVHELLAQAYARAKASGRSTIRSTDL